MKRAEIFMMLESFERLWRTQIYVNIYKRVKLAERNVPGIKFVIPDCCYALDGKEN